MRKNKIHLNKTYLISGHHMVNGLHPGFKWKPQWQIIITLDDKKEADDLIASLYAKCETD